MKKKLLALCGKESAYISRMYEYVLSAYGEDFEVVLFTDESQFKDFIMETPVEIAIADDGFAIENSLNIKIAAELSEEPGVEGKIYKYMPCNTILQDVMAQCAKHIQSERLDVKKEIIGIYTPIKRCFQTTFSITLGEILAKSHKVLYLNFESYSGFELLCRSNGKSDLLDLVYFSECNEEDFSYRICSMKEKIGNLDYISPVKAYVRFYDISREQWEKLLDNLLEKTDYEYILLDLSEQVNGLFNILSKCSRIYTITDQDRMSSAKMAQYEDMIRMNYFESILEKTDKITIPRFREIPNDFEMLPYSELAGYIKRLLKYEDTHE